MTKEKILGVALTKEACRLCGKEVDGPIVMNSRLTKNEAKKAEDLHGECIGYAEKPCEECQGLMKQGFLLIECDESKTEDHSNPWRTGRQWVIKQEAAKRIFQNADLSKGAAFIPIEVSDMLGLKIEE